VRKETVGVLAIGLIILLVVGIVILGPWTGGQNPFYNPQESLPHIAAPSETPGEQVNATVVGSLSMSVSGSFHTMAPHNGPMTFDFTIDVTVNNSGLTAIDDFHVVKVTVYDVNATPMYTFGVVSDTNYTIAADSTWTEDYVNDRDVISWPSDFWWAESIFAQVLVTFNSSTEIILTTPMTSFWHAIE